MIIVRKSQFPGTDAELKAAVRAFRREVEDHKNTVGKPAPFPQYEILRELIFLSPDEYESDPETEKEVEAKEPGFREKFIDVQTRLLSLEARIAQLEKIKNNGGR